MACYVHEISQSNHITALYFCLYICVCSPERFFRLFFTSAIVHVHVLVYHSIAHYVYCYSQAMACCPLLLVDQQIRFYSSCAELLQNYWSHKAVKQINSFINSIFTFSILGGSCPCRAARKFAISVYICCRLAVWIVSARICSN